MKKQPQSQIARRRFLGVGTAGLVSTALGLPSLAWAAPSQSSPGSEPPVSLGYWQGSDRQPDLRDLHGAGRIQAELPLPRRLVAAETLPQGDPRFAERGARLTIHGIQIPEVDVERRHVRYLSFDALLRSHLSGAGEDLKFHAWRYDNRSVENVSAGASFAFPVSPACGLEMALETETVVPPKSLGQRVVDRALYGWNGPAEASRNDPTAVAQALCGLSLGREASRPKLVRGVYFVALPSARTGRLPQWNRYRVSVAGDRVSIVRSGHEREVPADFSYLMFSVDYPTRTMNPGVTQRGV